MAPLLIHTPDAVEIPTDGPEIKDEDASVTLRDNVDLSLSYSPDKLLSDFTAQYQQHCYLSCQKARSPSVATILNISWIATLRCFSPAEDIYLGRPEPGVYFITRLAQGAGNHVSAIELNSEAPVKNLVRDVSVVQSKATSQMPVDYNPSDDAAEKFLTTTISYPEGFSATTEGSSTGNSNTKVYSSFLQP
jgi:hypothetical protein